MIGLVATQTWQTDDELVARFVAGERAAFGEIVRRYRDPVFATCARWLGDQAVAEEVAQDVFVAAFRALPKFRGESSLSTWIFRVAVNHCKNRRLYRHRRAHGRHEPLEGPLDDDAPVREFPAPGPGTDAGAHRQQARALVSDALAQLDEDQRAIVLLRDLDDLDYDQISAILGIPRGTVKSRLHRARTRLARILARTLTSDDVL